MSISYVELSNSLSDLKKHFVGKRINKMAAFSKNVYSFSLSNCETGIFSLKSKNPFIGYTKELQHFESINDSNIQLLKTELSNNLINNLQLKDDDRILIFRLEGINKVFKEETKYMFLELVPNCPNLIITDANKTIRFVLKPSNEKRILLRNALYEFPECRPFKKTDSSKIIDFNLLVHEIIKDRKYEKYYLEIKYLNSKLVSTKKKIMKLRADVEQANNHINDNQIGDLILTNLSSIKMGQKEFLIDNISILLNPKFKPFENANFYYKQAKKAKHTIKIASDELEKANNDIFFLENLITSIDNSDEQTLETLFKEFEIKNKINTNKRTSESTDISPSNHPYKISFENTTICYGKNAKQNDFLTFCYDTSKNHYWMHIMGDGGSHLIIKSDNPSERLIQICSEIICHLSKKMNGEVMLTKRKNVKKGVNPGQVIVNNFNTIRVKSISQLAINLCKQSTKI